MTSKWRLKMFASILGGKLVIYWSLSSPSPIKNSAYAPVQRLNFAQIKLSWLFHLVCCFCLLTRSSATAKSTARPSCLVGVLYDISREIICWYYFTQLAPKATEFGEITQNARPLRRSRSFKVTDFGTNRKPICDFLLVIQSNLPPILHRFQVMVDYW